MIDYNSIGRNKITTFGTQSVTGTTAITILSSVTIPANKYRAGDFLLLDSMLNRTGTAASFTVRYYWVAGSTPTLTGAIQISSRTCGSTITYFGNQRRIYIRTADGTGTGLAQGTEVTLDSIFTDTRSFVKSNVAINWTVTGTLMVTAQLTNTGSTVRSYYLKIWEW
jgi:hypothetical protein